MTRSVTFVFTDSHRVCVAPAKRGFLFWELKPIDVEKYGMSWEFIFFTNKASFITETRKNSNS